MSPNAVGLAMGIHFRNYAIPQVILELIQNNLDLHQKNSESDGNMRIAYKADQTYVH